MSFFKKSSLFFVAILLFACSQTGDATVQKSQKHDFKIVTIAQGFEHPWSLAFLPDDSYLVTERPGRLWRVFNSGQKVQVTGVPNVFNEGQGGLLDITPEPNFKNSGFVYFSYAGEGSDGKANTEVARAKLNLASNTLSDLEVIFKATPKVEGSNHWGSRLLFAPDGFLYITLGERYDYKEEAQNPKNNLGTIVRLNPNGSVPKSNPFANGAQGHPSVFTYGNRNVQGIAVHPKTQEIWFHEHGPKGGDEVNILKSGANYGWPAVTFGESYWGTEISDKTTAPGMQDPILQWTPSIAPSGMAFYTGDKFPHWQNNLFVGALAHTHLRRLEFDGHKVIQQEVLLKGLDERIRDVRTSADGYIYVLTDSTNGQILRLEPK